MRVSVLAGVGVGLVAAVVTVQAQAVGVREVTASTRSLIQLHTKLRYTTMVVLPDDEEILDVVCGDRDFWVISASQNIAHVKPAKEGAATNLNLVTASGAVYSFLLAEERGTQPDLKVYITADPAVTRGTPKYYSANQVNALQSELTETRAAVQLARHESDQAIATFREQYPGTMQFVYGTPKYEKPFLVRSIWNDGHFTYIKSDAHELPTLYEVRDGQPELVNFQVDGGTYVVPKLLDQGYLALGKNRFAFRQEK